MKWTSLRREIPRDRWANSLRWQEKERSSLPRFAGYNARSHERERESRNVLYLLLEVNARARVHVHYYTVKIVARSWDSMDPTSLEFLLILQRLVGPVSNGRAASQDLTPFPSLFLFFLSAPLMQTGSSPSWKQNDKRRKSKEEQGEREGGKTGLRATKKQSSSFLFLLHCRLSSASSSFSSFSLSPLSSCYFFFLFLFISVRHLQFCATSTKSSISWWQWIEVSNLSV